MLAMYLSFTQGDIVTHYNDRLSIYVVIETIGIFLLFKNFNKFNLNIGFLNNPDSIFRKAAFSLVKYKLWNVFEPFSYKKYLTCIFQANSKL